MRAAGVDDVGGRQNFLLICHDQVTGRSMPRSARALRPMVTRVLGVRGVVQAGFSGVALVGGLPLDEAGTVQCFCAMLESLLDRRVPFLWLLDHPSLRDEIQARVLGADATSPSRSPATLIRSTADRLPVQIAILRMRRMVTRNGVLREVGARIGTLTAPANRVGGIRTLVARVLRSLRGAADAPEVGAWLDRMLAIHHPTYRHCMLTTGVAAALAATLGLDRHDCLLLVRATLLHDIGKILIPAVILDKPGPLAPAEVDALRDHPQLGFEMLLMQGDHDPAVSRIVRHHQELLDGSGYPSGIRGTRWTGCCASRRLCRVDRGTCLQAELCRGACPEDDGDDGRLAGSGRPQVPRAPGHAGIANRSCAHELPSIAIKFTSSRRRRVWSVTSSSMPSRQARSARSGSACIASSSIA